ncbi:hypothetical protein [Acinetobacter sp. MD2]|uniref:hypothetical protein n=1 Tax=Acinetobacter sp. MD2 TaxID=2600066 RepID=UPI002D1F277F|nr:hypothetical protein [Acinetobacter sp. MD2]MEB3766379.1 hypothetical protein [Acinetobacter sp. MD2]
MKSDLIQFIGIHHGYENKDIKRLLSFNDLDGITHNLLIPESYFINGANRALKIMARYGLMPNRANTQMLNQLIASHPLSECEEVSDIQNLQFTEIWTTEPRTYQQFLEWLYQYGYNPNEWLSIDAKNKPITGESVMTIGKDTQGFFYRHIEQIAANEWDVLKSIGSTHWQYAKS